ncbi:MULTISPECIES: ABC transporter permease subunit [Streptomyces]|uniref:ABC transporter permease subunit n=1 Tax=Streptomyces TaxID=1883 RepID=UPI0004C669CB|nr:MULTISPECIES: ABC transporter permease subunit [unclassified Streptomyces]KPC84744.1 ABC transporter permease [Streptomyces sp. NRRL S-4]
MNIAVLTRSLADNRRGLAGWSLGTAAVAMIYASTYPSQRENTASLPEAMREALHIDATAAGYLHASVFGVILPLLATIYGIATGSRALAADEESGRLDLLMAHPVTRTRLVLQRFASLAAGAVAVSLLVWLALLAIRDSAGLTSVTPAEFLAQCLNLALLAITFGALALAIGAAVGRRSVVLAASAAVGVLTYTAHSFAAQIGADWMARLSPFHYYIDSEPLRNGFQWADATVLTAMTAVIVTTGIVRFNRRDLS